MKFGLCLNSDKAKNAVSLGADYTELNCMSVYKMTNSEFKELKRAVADGEIVTYSCNGLVISDLRLTGDDVNFGKIAEYADKAFLRMRELGVTMLVFGSGQAKNVPEGFSMEKAWDQLYEVGSIFSDVAGKHGQTIAVEPLRRAEVNIVNTVSDAAHYASTVNRNNFKILADFYHVNENGEPLSDIIKYKDLLVHTHIASPKRCTPDESDRAFIIERIELLNSIGYSGGVSFEGAYNDGFSGIPEMISLMRGVV